MTDPNPVRLVPETRISAPTSDDSRLDSEDRASVLAFIEGDDLLDLLDATGDTIHGTDPTS